MPGQAIRSPLLIFILPMLGLGVLPNPALAQYFPRLEALTGVKSAAWCECICPEERTDLTTTVFEESCGRPFRRFFCEGEWYLSWGFSREWWARTNVHVSQPSQGNNFTIFDLRGSDSPGSDSIFGAQYNIRIGRFVDEARTVAIEFNMDHTKYSSNLGQTARIAGTIAGTPVNADYRLDESFFRYNLHNGVNHLMINVVKRVPLIGETNERFSVAGIAKVGVGAVVPHADNTIMGQFNDVGKKVSGNLIGTHSGWWQLDGWTAGVEAGFRVTLAGPFYFEITDKVAFARLSDVPVYQGTARHNLWMNEIVLSVGVTFGGGR